MFVFLISSILLFVVILLLIQPDPRKGILLLLPSMGFIAGTWNITFAGLSLIKITYGLVAVIMITRTRAQACVLPSWWRNTALFLALTSVFGVIWRPLYFSFNLILFIDLILRALNFYLGFFLFPAFFQKREDFQSLLYALVFTAIFPLLVEYYQLATGVVFNLRQTRGLTRLVGLYHDAVTNKIFYQQALISIVILLGSKLETAKTRKYYLSLLVFLILVGSFFLYSKSMVTFLLFWILALTVIGKKLHWGILGVVFVLLINLYMDGQVFDNVYQIFERDIDVQMGTVDEKYLLSGRGMIWTEALHEFDEMGTFAYLFGAGWTPPAHNEWLRILFLGGICSVILFVFFQLFILWQLVSNYLKKRSFHILVTILLFASYLLDCIGIVPGLYPSYNWFLWGVIGCLLIHGDQILNTSNDEVTRFATIEHYGSFQRT